MIKPEAAQLDAAHALLERLATEHGLAHLRHGDEFGEIVADVAEGRSYFDVVTFEEAVEGRAKALSRHRRHAGCDGVNRR